MTHEQTLAPSEPRPFPAALAEALAIRLDCIGEDDVEFEPYDAFLSADATTDWIRSWTRNSKLTGDDFRMFGQDGTGGVAAFWLVRPGRETAEQPVVFLGSEGETGVVARDLDALLWLLADGFGPAEAALSFRGWDPRSRPHPRLTAVAERHAPQLRATATAVIEVAAREFPDFDDIMMALAR